LIRKAFVQNRVLQIYRKIESIQFPLNPNLILPLLPIATKTMSYKELALVTSSSINDVSLLCGSYSGATHYDAINNRCLILYNSAQNAGRMRWTLFHEIGHICLGHLNLVEEKEIADGEYRPEYKTLEQEADFFAWNIIAPLPIMRLFNVRSAQDVQSIFGLSLQAASLHYERYLHWMAGHIKTAWENDIVSIYKRKGLS